jgi:hypothetical protein
MPRNSIIHTFWDKIEKTDACWIWRGTMNANGYGRIKWGRKHHMVHRLAYEFWVAPIPNGLTLDHLCRNRACVNPDHLEVVTMRENILRGESFAAVYARRTHCAKGHAYDKANTYVPPRGGRECRICKKAYMDTWLKNNSGRRQ